MKWLNAKLNKPRINNQDKFSKENKESARVLLWIDTYGHVFGKYCHVRGRYLTEGVSGFHQDRITHFAYLTTPNK